MMTKQNEDCPVDIEKLRELIAALEWKTEQPEDRREERLEREVQYTLNCAEKLPVMTGRIYEQLPEGRHEVYVAGMLHAPPGRGRRPNMRAQRIASACMDLFHTRGLEARPARSGSDLKSPFTRFVAAVFKTLDVAEGPFRACEGALKALEDDAEWGEQYLRELARK